MAQQDALASVVDSAREAFDNGDHVFQYTQSAGLQEAFTGARERRPFQPVQYVEILNEICRQGWELVNGSVSQWDPGNSVYMVGFYTFRRCEANRQRVHAPAWQAGRVPTRAAMPAASLPAYTADAGGPEGGEPVAPYAPDPSWLAPVNSAGRIDGPGWYHDPSVPEGRFQRRWWDGNSWTDRIDA